MTTCKALGAALIGAALCSVVAGAYLAWGTAAALFVAGVWLYVAGYTLYQSACHHAAVADYEARTETVRGRASNRHLN